MILALAGEPATWRYGHDPCRRLDLAAGALDPVLTVGRGLVLDGGGPLGVGANLGDAVWWPLIVLVLWTLPLGVLGLNQRAARPLSSL